MNKGIFAQDVYGKAGFEERLPKSLSGPPNVVNLPYHYPPANDWKNNTQQYLILVHDTTTQNNTRISIPYGVQSFITDITIDWGDGTVEQIRWTDTGNSRSAFHTYSSHGVYTVIVSGRLGRLGMANPIGTPSLIKCYSFGNLGLVSIGAAFHASPSLTEAPAELPSSITTMNSLFSSCTIFNDEKIKYWDTTNVINTNNMFFSARRFNQDLGSWNMANVTNISAMFGGAISFNNGNSDSINNWNTGSVTNMSNVFEQARNFNQPIANWNTSNVTSMNIMFFSAINFNQNLDNWNVRKVTTFANMFQSATNFNGSLSGWAPGADTAGTSFQNMFIGATNFTGSGLDTWDVSKATRTDNMFRSSKFNTNISGWNVSNVTNMEAMFSENSSFNQNLDNWNVSKCTTLGGMFDRATNFNGSLSGWSPGISGAGCSCASMFSSASNFNQPLSSWNTSNVTNMGSMFASASKFNQNIGNWNTNKVTAMDSMFNRATLFNQDIGNWNMSGVGVGGMFVLATSFNNGGSPSISGWNMSNTTSIANLFWLAQSFNQPINSWDTSKVTSALNAFNTAVSFNQYLGSWNVSKITTMQEMFASATAFKGSGLENWNLAGLNVSTALTNFAAGCSFPTGQYDLILNSWNTNKASGVNGVGDWRTALSPHFGTSKYTAAGSGARASLISYGWTITDGGLQT